MDASAPPSKPRRQPRLVLTERLVERAQSAAAGTGAYILRDTVRAFGLRVTERGTKAFIYETKIHGRNRRITIGLWPSLSVAEARKKAHDYRAAIGRGENPADEKRSASKVITLAELRDRYHDAHARTKRRSWPEDERRINQHFGDWLSWQVRDLTPEVLAQRHAQIGEKSGRVEANRALELLRAMFAKAIQWEIFQGKNPAKAVDRFTERPRRRFLKASELERVVDALEAEPEPWRSFFSLLLMLGCRRGELLSARWADVDLEERTLTITQEKTEDPDVKPFGPDAAAIIAALPSRGSSEYLFPGVGASGHLIEPKKAWARLRERAKVKNVTIHDLRRTYATILSNLGYSLHIIARSLGQRAVASAGRYAHLDDTERSRAVGQIEEVLRRFRSPALPPPQEDEEDDDD